MDVRQADLPKAEAEELEVLSLTKNNGLVLQSERFGKRIATEDTSKYKVVREGQIVYNPYVIWEGAVHALRRYQAGLVSPVYPVWETYEPDGGFVDYLLRTPPLIEAYNRVCSGAVNRRRSIRDEAFTAIPVSVPEVRERRAIASVLQTVQRGKEACERVLAATRQLKQSLLHHLFTYGPVPFPQADHVPLKETEMGPMPEHWRFGVMADIIHRPEYGLTASASTASTGPQFLRITDIQGGRVNWNTVPYCSCSRSDSEALALKDGDIVVARIGATTGKTFLIRSAPPAVFASYLIRIRARSGAEPEFIYRFTETRWYWQQIDAAKGGRLKQGVNIPVLQGLAVPLPPLSEQREIARQLSALDAKLAAAESRRSALAALFQSLLHHLLTARLRLPEFLNAKTPSRQEATETTA